MTTHSTITLIPGDGIGREVIPAARRVLDALDLSLTFQEADAGFAHFEAHGDALPPETLALCEASDAVLFGATSSPMTKVAGYRSPILTLRRHFDLFANLRPALGGGIDLLIVRENTEGLYSGRERVEDGGATAIAERVITARASERITRIACEWAARRRGRLTIVHKANVLKETCGLFRQTAFAVTAEYPELQVDELLVDTAAMWLAQDATRFDVIVTTNLFGDILSDLAAGLTGGLGLAPSANLGVRRPGVFEPVHGSAPDIAGQGSADPRAAILSAAMLLDSLGFDAEAGRVRTAAYSTPHTGRTGETTDAIIAALAAAPPADDWRDLRGYLDLQGRLTLWPSSRNRRAAQLRALEYLAGKFTLGRRYTEREVNELLNGWHTFGDPASLRRDLIAERYLARERDGSAYWRIEVDGFDGGQ